jgi:hypothetical protein
MENLPPQQAHSKVVTVSYNDLILFDPQHPNELFMEQIGCIAFGPNGLGILQVSDVPNFTKLRLALLPLAAQIPDVPDIETTCVDPDSLYSVGWSHGKEVLASTGQPDKYKGSYYANPLTPDLVLALSERDGHCPKRNKTASLHPEFFAPNIWPTQHLPQLESLFCDMGKLLHYVGCLIAEVCDAYCYSRHGIETSIAPYLRRSLNATGRLLHYFPITPEKDCTETTSTYSSNTASAPALEQDTKRQPWCAWHNDHVRFPAMQLWACNRFSVKR